MSTLEVKALIAKRYHESGDYKRMYEEHGRLEDAVWAARNRPDYETDLWYNLSRNEISLEMLDDICTNKDVLSIGGGQWIEKALLDQLKGNITRTDIVEGEGIIQADAADLPFDNESFDVVICRELIEHVPDTDMVFSEIRRVLRDGGYLHITTPNAYTLVMDGTFHVRLYSPISFLVELEGQGFEIVKKRGNIPYIFQGLTTYSVEGYTMVLDDFKEIDRITRDYENRYYLSTQLFALCRYEQEMN